MPINILHITPDFDLTSGVTRHLLDLLKIFNNDKEYSIHLITNRGDAIDLLKNYNIKLNIIPFSKGRKGIFGFLKFKNQIEDYCVANNIKIIHTHHRYPELAAYYVSNKQEVKTITTAHSIVKGYKRMSFRSDKVIAVSNTVKDHIINHFSISPERVEIIYNPVIFPLLSYNKKQLKEKLQIPENKFVLLFVGRISKEKGTEILLDALWSLKSELENLLLIIVGTVEENNLFNNYSFDENHLKYFPPTENISQYYELSDIVVLPSRIDSFPYVMLEAGWFKKPFVGSKTGGIAEFIEDGVNGFLCEPGNAAEFTKKIRFVIDNKEKAGLAAENLYEKVKLHCNSEKYFEKLIRIYNNLLNDK